MKRSNPRTAHMVGFSLLGLAAAWVVGCRQSEASPSREAAATLTAGGAAAARVDNPNYVVTIRAAGPFEVGKEGFAEVVLETKPEYHVNDQFPFKFTPREGDGVTYKGPVGRDGGTFEEKKAVFRVPFTPTRSGEVKVGGKLSLSVCSDKHCLMEKQDLEVTAAVK